MLVEHRREGGDGFVADLGQELLAVVLAGLAFDGADLLGRQLADLADQLRRRGLAAAFLLHRVFGGQFFDHAADFDDRVVAELDGVGDRVLGHLVRADLDHVHVILRAGDDDLEVAAFGLFDRREQDEFPVDLADLGVGGGRDERDVADGDAGRRGDAGQHVGVVLAVVHQGVQLDLHFVHEPGREQGTQRPVDQTADQHFARGRAAFALHEPAGELAGRGAALAVVDLEREEVDAFARLGADHGAEYDGVAVLNGDAAVGQLGERAGAEGEGAAGDFFRDGVRLHGQTSCAQGQSCGTPQQQGRPGKRECRMAVVRRPR